MNADDLNRRVGRRARALRQNAGISLREAAPRLGIAYTMVSRLERGELRWNIEHMAAAAELYGVEPAELLAPDSALELLQVIRQQGTRGILHWLAARLPGKS